LTRVLSHHVHPGEAVPHARQWWQKHPCEEDASEVFYSGSFGSIFECSARALCLVCIRCCQDFLAPVSLLLEIVLVKPDPIGTAARHVIFTREASFVVFKVCFVEVSHSLLIVGIHRLLMPSQREGGFGTSI